jgi:hypothetical protein
MMTVVVMYFVICYSETVLLIWPANVCVMVGSATEPNIVVVMVGKNVTVSTAYMGCLDNLHCLSEASLSTILDQGHMMCGHHEFVMYDMFYIQPFGEVIGSMKM